MKRKTQIRDHPLCHLGEQEVLRKGEGCLNDEEQQQAQSDTVELPQVFATKTESTSCRRTQGNARPIRVAMINAVPAITIFPRYGLTYRDKL